MRQEKIEDCQGVCEGCKGEFEERTPPVQKLYRFEGNLLCGECCIAIKMDNEAHERAYGSD